MVLMAGVVRVSHMGSRKADAEEFHAARDQIALIEAEAARRNVAVEILPSELGVSGGLPLEKRPSLSTAVSGVQSGKYAGVMAAYLSRFGRDLEGGLKAWRLIEQAGGQVIIVAENIDTSTVNGRFMRNTYLTIANMEREQHQERFGNLRQWATQAGIWQRRQTPLGYSRDPDTRRLVPDAHADDVRKAFIARGSGESISAIARELMMTPSGARNLLRNRVYLGELRVGEHVNTEAHPPLLDDDTFHAAQRPVPRPGRSGAQRAPALLAGLARCAGCGHLMSRATTKVPVYTCARLHSGSPCPAPAAITLARLDTHVERIALTELAELTVTASEHDDSEAARKRLWAAERELSAYVGSVSAASIGGTAFAVGARARAEQVEAASRELHRVSALRSALPAAGSGADAWTSLDERERNTLLRSLLHTVIVRRAGGRGHFVPLETRVRVLKNGADFPLPVKRGATPLGVAALPFPDANDPRVLGIPTAE